MQLRDRVVLLIAAALLLPLIDLGLSFVGAGLKYRVAFVIVGVAITAVVGVRVLRRTFSDLRAIRKAIDETAGAQGVNPLEVRGADEIGLLAEAVRVLRERLTVMNQLLIQSSRIESLNILGSIVVHDMKNVSFRLRCLAQNLETNYGDPDFDKAIGRTLNETTHQMDQMVRRFREQRDTVIVKLRINLNEVVKSAMNNVRRDAAGLRITEEYNDLPTVWADAMLVENAVYNILTNACDAMPRGGHLAVRTHLIPDGESGPALALVEIADSGPGMPDDFIRDELFAPFVTTKQRGLGLGLYTCQQIIRMHGGRIRVYSELGRGSVFSVYLPITD